MRYAAILMIVEMNGAAAMGASLKPVDVASFFIAPDREASLIWQVEDGDLAGPVSYHVRDMAGSPVMSGEATAARGRVVVKVELPTGYYDIELAETEERFGIAVLPTGSDQADPVFCIDSALSWLVQDDDVRDRLVSALPRCGIAMSRERLGWGQIHRTPDDWDWQAWARYETMRNLYRKHSVPMLEMFHDAPDWQGKIGAYPRDLTAAAQSWSTIAQRFGDRWAALEVWNEPEIFFGGHFPADQYVALVRAVVYGVDKTKVDVPLVGGVTAYYKQPFVDNAARNGLLDCVDAISFHSYQHAEDMESLIGQYRSWLAAYGHPAMPLWITECGRPWQSGPNRPPTDEGINSALDIVMKAVESRACGIVRYFAFVYPFYEEGQNNFGMMGRRGTPLPAMVAYANLAATLGGRTYRGDLKCEDDSIRRARVFGDDQRTVAVIYTAAVEADATVKLPVPVQRIEGMDGRLLVADADGAVPMPDGLAYVWLDAEQIGDALQVDTAAMHLWQSAQGVGSERRPLPPIVLRFDPQPTVHQHDSLGYRVPAEALEQLPLQVTAFNLSDQARIIQVALTLPPDAQIIEGRTAQSVDVPPLASVTMRWQVDVRQPCADEQGIDIRFVADAEGYDRVVPLVIRIREASGD